MDPYRSPAKGLALTPTLVPEVSTLRCRLLGHKLRGNYELLRSSLGPTQQVDYDNGHRFFDYTTFPSPNISPSRFLAVWCERCGREWRRES